MSTIIADCPGGASSPDTALPQSPEKTSKPEIKTREIKTLRFCSNFTDCLPEKAKGLDIPLHFTHGPEEFILCKKNAGSDFVIFRWDNRL